jgi:RimJ/RimL family protein N-acetyltransferase
MTSGVFESVKVTTPRLMLRNLMKADVPALFDIFSHPEVMRYWSSPALSEAVQAQEMLAQIQEGYQSGAFLQLGVVRNSDQALIGTCTLHAIHWKSRRAEIGYILGRPYWGAGYMNEALRAFIDYAFQTLNLNRLEADIDPRNLASQKTLERLGFRQEGYLRERWIVGDEVSDSALYGLLRKEWT